MHEAVLMLDAAVVRKYGFHLDVQYKLHVS